MGNWFRRLVGEEEKAVGSNDIPSAHIRELRERLRIMADHAVARQQRGRTGPVEGDVGIGGKHSCHLIIQRSGGHVVLCVTVPVECAATLTQIQEQAQKVLCPRGELTAMGQKEDDGLIMALYACE